jgi:sec-independent protein translocase protein TatB
MFGIGGGEFIGLILLALLLIGPDKLPQFSADFAKLIRKVRDIAQGATNDLRDNLGAGYEDLKVTDLHPKKFITKHINEVLAEPTEQIQELKKSARIDPDLL